MKYEVKTDGVVIGEKIRERRKKLKMTQRDLANFVGVTFQQIQKYESGRNRIFLTTFIKICKGLKVTHHYFLEDYSFKEGKECIAKTDTLNCDIEKKLLSTFRGIENNEIKERVLSLLEAVVLNFDEEKSQKSSAKKLAKKKE